MAPIEDRMRENCLMWFGYMQQRPKNARELRRDLIHVNNVKRTAERTKTVWLATGRKSMSSKDLKEDPALYKAE